MGLGKTIQVVALVVATLQDLKQQVRHENETHATLIVVPPALVSQWLAEIRKITGDALVCDFFDHNSMKFTRKSEKLGPADIVITTYNALEKSRTQKNAAKLLTSTCWGRIVLDEMQEIRSSTSAIAKNCEKLQCNRRWMLSGTPLYEGVEDLRGELCFLRLEPFAGNCDDGFFNFAIQNHWDNCSRHGLDTLRVLSLLLLRRSKSMTICDSGLPILGLKPLTIIYEPVPQDPSERAFYCYLEYLVHATIKNDDTHDQTKNKALLRLLREMCVSGVMLNGGFGVSSQLATLNRLVIGLNRKEQASLPCNSRLSCDEAIRYLSQVLDRARVEEGFETTLNLGGGGGVTRRDRAYDSALDQYKESRTKLLQACREIEVWRCKRARAVS